MTRYLLAAILAGALALAGCGGNDAGKATTPASASTSTPAPTSTPQDTPSATPAPTREAKGSPTPPPSSAPSTDAADAACEEWQDAGGEGSASISTPEGDTTCVGVAP